MYLERKIDSWLINWKNKKNKSPALIPIVDKKDPRYRIVDELLDFNTRSLSYTLEIIPSDISDVGTIRDDNTLLLRANDIFQISSIKENQYTDEIEESSCSDLFSSNYDFKIFAAISRAFNSEYLEGF